MGDDEPVYDACSPLKKPKMGKYSEVYEQLK